MVLMNCITIKSGCRISIDARIIEPLGTATGTNQTDGNYLLRKPQRNFSYNGNLWHNSRAHWMAMDVLHFW